MKKSFLPILCSFIFIFIIFLNNISFGANTLNDNFYYPVDITNHFEITTEGGSNLVSQTLYDKYGTYYMLAWFIGNGKAENTKIYLNSGVPYPTPISQWGDHCVLYTYNKDSKSWKSVCWWYFSDYGFPFGNSSGNIANYLKGAILVSSSHDIYKDSSCKEVFFKASTFSGFKIELSTNYNTNGPIIAYSNYFNLSDATKYRCYISTDAKDWILMNYETFNDIANNVTKFRFNYKIFKNGCYYFKFLNTETNDENYLSYNVTNIVKNSSNSGFTDSGIPQPFCTYERVNKEFIIKTQSFSASDMQKYRCFYTKTPVNDYSSWDEMSMGSFTNTLTGETEYYFFFTVPADSEDCTFYFVFYDYTLNEYGAPSSLKCVFDKMNEYADSLNPTVSEKNNRFTELLKYFKERFGFLTYPFEFLINFANRIFNINYSEPVIHIPELRDPFNNNIIFSGLDFNFNSLLNNGTFNYIYNIYLVAVDFVIVVLFIFLCKKEIEEVFGNG